VYILGGKNCGGGGKYQPVLFRGKANYWGKRKRRQMLRKKEERPRMKDKFKVKDK
jgi:hypothetical protein